MAYFQNLFDEYQGCWVLGAFGDTGKSMSLIFKVPGNKNRGEAFIAWNTEPYDLSTNDTLTFNFAYDQDFKNYAALSINVAGATASATTASEIRDLLNNNATFSDRFTAGINAANGGERGSGPFRVFIRQKKPAGTFRTYISNTSAELALKFNKYGGVADIPSYFEKDTIANRFATPEANSKLIRLSHTITGNTAANPTEITSVAHGLATNDVVYIVGSNSTPTINGQQTVTVTSADAFTVPVNVTTAGTAGEWLSTLEYQIVTDAGLDYTQMLLDWQHLRGRYGYYEFIKNTLDGSNRVITKLVYPSGSGAGAMAKKTFYTYTGAATVPSSELDTPYILTASDLMTP